jgi:signal transduction histidine kinase
MDDLFNSIKNGASRTTEIVRGLRNFTRLDEDSLKKANIEEGIESTLVILRSNLGKIKLVKEYGKVPDINCFPGQLNQVFMNIISNAIQAMNDEGGILIKTTHANKKIQVIIQDSGNGMSEDVRSRIFEPFFTTKDVGKGTGLGLSISYGIIQRHNGTIEVQSEPGQGTTFIISLPDDLKITDIETQSA